MKKNKQIIKAGIKKMMKDYKFTLEQAIYSAHKMNPDYEILINQVELELTTDQLMGRI